MDQANQNQNQNTAAQNAAMPLNTTDSTSKAPSALITVSEKAAVQVKMIQERESRINHFLRVSVVGGGCSGLSYKLSFEEAPKEKDKVVEAFGIKVVVDAKSALFLKGIELDFTDGLNGQGFVFNNPNAKSSCGCGSSFSA